MKGRAGQGAKKLRLCLVGLAEEAEQLFTFVWGKLERQQASESSMPAQRTMQHLAEIQHFLAAVTGGWRAVFALSTSPYLRLVWSPGCKADFVPPLSCKWDTKTLLRSSKAKGLPVNCKISLLCVGLDSCSSQSLSNLLGFISTFPFQAMHPGPHFIHCCTIALFTSLFIY